MGLLTILKKMKQKERELRLLMLYPPGSPSRQGSGARPGGRSEAPPTGRGGANCPWCVTHVGSTNRSGGGGGAGEPTPLPGAQAVGLRAPRPPSVPVERERAPEVTRPPPPSAPAPPSRSESRGRPALRSREKRG